MEYGSEKVKNEGRRNSKISVGALAVVNLTIAAVTIVMTLMLTTTLER